MKITVFGPTGGTGRHVVRQALDAGHQVVAYARTPSKLTIENERLTVIQGEMDEPEKIAAAIAGSDAVISALGPTSNTPARPLTAGMEHIVAAMERHGVERLIATTGAGVAAPQDRPQLIGRLFGLALRLFARHVLADSQGMVKAIRESDLDWTVARAPRLHDNPGGEIVVGYAGQGPGTQLARAGYARFLLSQLESDEWIRKMPMLSN